MIFFQAVLDVLLELAPWLLLGTGIAGLLHVWLPRGFVEQQFSGPSGVVKAVLLGIPLPLCSCSVIPAGLGLRQDGASQGAAVGFMTATPQTGVDSVLVAASFLGWPFALFKVGAALVTGVTAGWLADRLPDQPVVTASEHSHGHGDTGWRAGVAHGVDLLRMIWRWLVFGVLVSAAVTVFVPPTAFEGLLGGSMLLGYAIALGISVPLYVCATASVPIAAALVAAGLPTGAALVFLMAGPATNLATLGAVRKGFGTAVAGVYLGVIVVGSVLFGLLYESLFGALTLAVVHVHPTASPLGLVSVAILLGLMGLFAFEDLRRATAPVPTAALEIPVTGMTCNGCAGRLERVLRATDGVSAVSVSFADGRAQVEGRLAPDAIRAIIRQEGFEPG